MHSRRTTRTSLFSQSTHFGSSIQITSLDVRVAVGRRTFPNFPTTSLRIARLKSCGRCLGYFLGHEMEVEQQRAIGLARHRNPGREDEATEATAKALAGH